MELAGGPGVRGGVNAWRRLIAGLLLLTGASLAQAQRHWQVSPDGQPLSLEQALRAAGDGDTIELASGDYLAPTAVISQRRLTLRGASPRPRLLAGGRSAEGKAIWVVRGGDIRIENLEFRGARVPDRNGAGIRLERGRLWLRACVFADNETGLMTANDPRIELHIEDSLFEHTVRTGPGLAHQLYVGSIGTLHVQGSRFHQAAAGHLIKSRARKNWIAYNLIADGPLGNASYEIEMPNGGDATLLGNIVVQGETTQNPVVIAYGAEGLRWERNRLRLSHNTLLNQGLMPAQYLKVWADRVPGTEVLAINNLSVGVGSLQFGNRGVFAGNLHTLRPVLAAPELHDYGLRAKAWTADKAIDTERHGDDLLPVAEFSLPIGTRALAAPRLWAPGALQR